MTLDAHLDLRDLDGGQTNSNPIRGLLEDGREPRQQHSHYAGYKYSVKSPRPTD